MLLYFSGAFLQEKQRFLFYFDFLKFSLKIYCSVFSLIFLKTNQNIYCFFLLFLVLINIYLFFVCFYFVSMLNWFQKSFLQKFYLLYFNTITPVCLWFIRLRLVFLTFFFACSPERSSVMTDCLTMKFVDSIRYTQTNQHELPKNSKKQLKLYLHWIVLSIGSLSMS